MSLSTIDEKIKLKVSELLSFAALHGFPVAAYRLPGVEKQELICQMDSNLKLSKAGEDLKNEKGFVVRSGSVNSFFQTVIRPDIFLSGEVLQIADTRKDEFEQLWKDFNNRAESLSFHLLPVSDIYEADKEEFCGQVEAIQKYIQEGKIQKAILSRIRLVAKPADFSFATVFNQLCLQYPTAFVSLVYLPRIGCWLGASPELLLSLEGNTLQTVSLAGTKKIEVKNEQATGNKQQATNPWSEKEKEEQQIVSDYMLNCIKKYFGDSINVEGPVTAQAGSFAHLKTIFTVDDEGENLKENFSRLVDLLHPTPAISGFPKQDALEVIHAVEKHDRDLYAGFLGSLNMKNHSQLFVNLRCMQVFEDKIALYVGAGITAGSHPEKEWEETELKTRTMLAVLND